MIHELDEDVLIFFASSRAEPAVASRCDLLLSMPDDVRVKEPVCATHIIRTAYVLYYLHEIP